jgi:hypothetical protein
MPAKARILAEDIVKNLLIALASTSRAVLEICAFSYGWLVYLAGSLGGIGQVPQFHER